MKDYGKIVCFDFEGMRKRNAEFRKLINLLNKYKAIKKNDSSLEIDSKPFSQNLNNENNTICVNFKTKRKRDPKMEAFYKECFDYALGKIKHKNHLLPPEPNCYSRDELIQHQQDSLLYDEPRLIDGHKKANDHIFSCKRCRAFYSIVSRKLAKFSIQELREKNVAQLVYELF